MSYHFKPREKSRQLVHLSGVLFILLAQFMLPLVAAATFFLIALTFLLYSLYIQREQNSFTRLVGALDRKIRGKLLHFERDGLPFQGAFYFYFGCGVAFVFFPHVIATTVCLILAVSDSIATIVGVHLGRRVLFRKKTVEGTVVFFVSALLIAVVLIPEKSLQIALVATAAELLPALSPMLNRRGLLDDNLLIPLLAGAVALI